MWKTTCAVIAVLSYLLYSCSARPQANDIQHLSSEIDSIVSTHKGDIAVALIACGDTLQVGASAQLPLMSSFKLHVGLAALQAMERYNHPLDSMINIAGSALRDYTWSPMCDSTGIRDISLSMERLLYFSTCRSDNNACDILIDIAGGIDSVAGFIARTGIADFELAETEASMHADISRCYGNKTTALSLCELMAAVYDDSRRLSPAVACKMRSLLAASTTGRDKIAAGLPLQAFVGHKSGLSDRRADGILIASCDVAAFNLSDGSKAFLAIMVQDSPESDATVSRLFSDLAETVYKGLEKSVVSENK